MEQASITPTEETQVVSDTTSEETQAPQTLEEYQAEYQRLQNENNGLLKRNRELGRESADRRTKLTKFETEEEQRRQTSLSELDREKEARTAAENKITAFQSRLDKSELSDAATKLNVVDSDVAIKLLDAAKIERDEDGNISNAETLIKELIESKPYLVRGTTPILADSPINRTNQSRDNGVLPVFTHEQISDRAFYLANKEAIIQAGKENRIR